MDKALESYLTTALWSSTFTPFDEGYPEGHPLYGVEEGDAMDRVFSVSDFSDAAVRKAGAELDEFFAKLENAGLLDRAREYGDDEQIAHDFWLTRNHHGAGFWDGDYGPIGEVLTAIAHLFGESDLLVNEKGEVEIFS